MLFGILKLLHILAAIIAVGFNLSYVVWLVRGKMNRSHQLFALQGVKFMDDWLANPSYIVGLVTGLLMCYINQINIVKVHWILVPLVLFGVMGIVAFGFYSPTLSKQIRLLQEKGDQDSEYKAVDKKQTILGVILFVFALTIVGIMVIKPDF